MQKIIEQKKIFITVGELADRWSISTSAVYQNKCMTDRLKRFRFGKSVKFLLKDVEAIEREIVRA